MKAYSLLLLLLMTSCATDKLHKFGHKKVIAVKTFNTDYSHYMDTKTLAWHSQNESCFESNPENKKTITVRADELDFVIKYFYEKKVKVDVTLTNERKNNTTIQYLDTKYTQHSGFDLEVSYCYFKSYVLLGRNFNVLYASFREAD